VIAHQYKIRLKKAREPQHSLFPIDYSKIDMDLSKTTTELIDYRTAEKIILEYEWLKSMPHAGSIQVCYGIFFGNFCGGVLVFGYATTPLRNFPQFNFRGEVFVLHRGACCWWTPRNTASYFITQSLKLLKKDYLEIKIITATVDPVAGEMGTIYQSLGWYYVGIINKNNPHRNFIIDGKHIHSKTLYDWHGSSSATFLKKIYGDRLEIREYTDKLRYFYFVGTRKERKYNYERIKHLIKPYPKRAEEVSREKRQVANLKGVGQFHDSAFEDNNEKR